jgi:hypothetical protein
MLNSQSLAARLVPLTEARRKGILLALPRRKGERSQLFDTFNGAWYIHRGPLILDEDYDHTLNLVVDGDLTVRGTVDDSGAGRHLVVLGDLRCQNLLSRHLMVVTGSVVCAGLIFADHHDYAFEIWGETLEARALILTDKSARLPEQRALEYFYDSDRREARRGDSDVMAVPTLRFLGEDDMELSEDDRRAGATVSQVRPAAFDALREIVRRHPDVFSRPFDFARVGDGRSARMALLRTDCPSAIAGAAEWDPGLHLELALSGAASEAQLANLAASPDQAVLLAVANHPRTPAKALAALAKHKAALVRGAVVHHEALPEKHLARLARDRQPLVRQQVAAHRFAAPFLSALTRDRSADVRRAASCHPDLGDHDRLLLLMDVDPGVRRRALRYVPGTPEWVDRLMRTDDAELIRWAVERRVGSGVATTFAEEAEGLLDRRRAVREAWLKALGPVPELMRFFHQNAGHFIADESPALRRFLAVSVRDPERLTALSGDTVEMVRRAALDNLAAPADVLVAEAERLSNAPTRVWSVGDPEHLTHLQAVRGLLNHPRLPAVAVTRIHQAWPWTSRLEPHRNMKAAVALERAAALTPALTLDPEYPRWVEAVAGEVPPSMWAAWLKSDDGYLRSAARLNAATPLDALLREARRWTSVEMEDLGLNPSLSQKTPTGASLLQLLLNQDEEGVAVALASNPEVSLRILRGAAQRSSTARGRASITAWQAHGEIL